jgi:hypothetical protein
MNITQTQTYQLIRSTHAASASTPEQMQDAVFGVADTITGHGIPAEHSPISLQKDGWSTDFAVVADARGQDHLVLSTIEPDQRTTHTIFPGIPSDLELQTGPVAFRLHEDKGFLMAEFTPKAALEHCAVRVASLDQSDASKISEISLNTDLVRSGENFAGVSIGRFRL